MSVDLKNVDCMKYMNRQPDNAFDLAIVDPPYFSGPNKSGYYGKGYSSLGVQRANHIGNCPFWEVPDTDYFKELARISKNQIIFGANHFAGRFDSSSGCWIVWDKQNGGSSFADAELAYTSFKGSVRIFKYMWNGMHQGSFSRPKSKNEKRIHPTQKPIALYDFLLHKFAKPEHRIIDTHLGSGSSAIAAYYYGVDFVGCEIDKKHYDSALARFNSQTKQTAINFK